MKKSKHDTKSPFLFLSLPAYPFEKFGNGEQSLFKNHPLFAG